MGTRKSRGFTLIELMIVVAVVAILAAIALPSFADQMRKSRRAEAISSMQDVQLRLERWRVDHKDFTGSGVSVPTGHYKFDISTAAATPNEYKITGTPQGSQDKDSCKTLELTYKDGKVTRKPDGCW